MLKAGKFSCDINISAFFPCFFFRNMLAKVRIFLKAELFTTWQKFLSTSANSIEFHSACDAAFNQEPMQREHAFLERTGRTYNFELHTLPELTGRFCENNNSSGSIQPASCRGWQAMKAGTLLSFRPPARWMRQRKSSRANLSNLGI